MVRRPGSIPRRELARREAARREQLRRDEADRHFCDATFHFHHDDFAETASACELAVKLEPTHARACLLLCQALLRLERLDDALDAATRAISLGHREGHRERGAVYSEMHGRAAAEIGTRDSGAASDAADTADAADAASGHHALLLSALSDLNVALRIDSADARALRLRARARRALGDGGRAAEDDAAAARADAEETKENRKQSVGASGVPATFADADGSVCVVCLDAPRDTRLVPCEHSALCGDCAKECRDRQGACPICNAKIKAIEYGSFARTFAPAEAKMHLARLASAVKKAKEQADAEESEASELASAASLGGTASTVGSRASAHAMPTLTPVSFCPETARRAAEEEAEALRPGTPERDFSEYTVGAGMEDDLETPTTPAGNRASGVFGDVAGFGLTSSPTPMGGGTARAAGPDTPPRE